MKTYLYTLISCSLLLFLGACESTQEELFEKAPNERIEQRKDELKELLVSQPQGWQMIYFPFVENIFSDIDRNLVASKDYGVLFIERDFGKGGHTFFMKFRENGEVEMLSEQNYNATREIKTSHYTLSQNTYTQLDFTSPNYIFETGQTSFLFYKKNEDGSLIFTTNKYTDRRKEYIVLRPLPVNVEWENKMSTIFQTKLNYERLRLKNLNIYSPTGEEVFMTNFKKEKHTNADLRYSVFVRNMQPHIYNSNYFTGLGSGYVPLENQILFLPGIKVNDSVIFNRFDRRGNEYISEVKGFEAIIK